MRLINTIKDANKINKISDFICEKHSSLFENTSQHTRRQFSLLLASVLTSQPEITDIQTKLLQKILNQFELNDIRGILYEESLGISSEALLEAIKNIKEGNLEDILIIDCLVLLKSNGSLTKESEELIHELINFLEIDPIALSGIKAEVDKTFEFFNEKISSGTFSEKISSEDKSRELTEDVLSEGISGGVWCLEKNLKVDFPWQASNATFIFKNGAQLITDTDTCTYFGERNIGKQEISGEMKITNCNFESASLIFTLKEELIIAKCDFKGKYLRKNLSAAIKIHLGMLIISDSKFNVINACAIQAIPFTYRDDDNKDRSVECRINVRKCDFLDCGHVDMDSGAIIIKDRLYGGNCFGEITESIFTNCKGKQSGAIYSSELYFGLLLTNCKFNYCKSTKNAKEKDSIINSIAIYIQNLGDAQYAKEISPWINNCEFKNTSLQIDFNDEYGVIKSEIINCTFKNGQFIKK